MKNITIESAKKFLEENGYFTASLWHVNDVKIKYECTNEQAQKVLNDVLNGEWVMSKINESIDITAEVYNLPKKQSKYFAVSGFWKEDKEKFSTYIIKELDLVDDNEDEEIFYYGLSQTDIEHLILRKWDSEYEFVLTSYEEIKN